jgi:hypothetical protein
VNLFNIIDILTNTCLNFVPLILTKLLDKPLLL